MKILGTSKLETEMLKSYKIIAFIYEIKSETPVCAIYQFDYTLFSQVSSILFVKPLGTPLKMCEYHAEKTCSRAYRASLVQNSGDTQETRGWRKKRWHSMFT